VIKIAQLASYDINAGDNIATYNIRKGIENLTDEEVYWKSVSILPFVNNKNSKNFCISEFKKISAENDILIVGGGGLIEGDNKFDTKYKLPFSKDTLKHITIPIVCFGVGVNYFRNSKRSSISPEGLENLEAFVKKCRLFSVRNDGSHEIMTELLPNLKEKILEVPDPGLIFEYEHYRRPKVAVGFFQPAWNNGKDVIKSRNLTNNNLSKLNTIIEDTDLKVLPHTGKDYNFPISSKDRFIWQLKEFKDLVIYKNFMDIFKEYQNYDYGVVMRGHGQLCSIGLNVPSIYFSTQDKVLDFSNKNGFENYTVDITETEWHNKLKRKIDRLKTDKAYLEEWYDIRDQNMSTYRDIFTNYCREILV
tara:strand:- start:1683 stop:2768 length:1086 start_codon:yes stop_codon:yes gene_type:complete